MTKLKIFILSLTGVVVTIVIILFAGIAYIAKVMHDSPLCGEELIQQSHSTDGEFVANVYVRNCGATTGYVTHVNLAKKDDVVDPDFYGTIKEGEILTLEDKPEILMKWHSPTELELNVVGYDPKNLNVRKSWETVKISVK